MKQTKLQTMKITLLEKIMIGNILPAEGNIKTLIIIKDIKKKIELTQEDITNYGVEVMSDGRVKWNEEGTKVEFEIEFTELEKGEVKSVLQKMDKEKKLTVDHLSLVEKFGVISE